MLDLEYRYRVPFWVHFLGHVFGPILGSRFWTHFWFQFLARFSGPILDAAYLCRLSGVRLLAVRFLGRFLGPFLDPF